jgi:hypothetical protein
MMQKLSTMALLAAALVVLTGCYVQYVNSRVLPDTVIGPDKTYYVVRHANDSRQIDLTVANEMRAMGLHQVSSGLEADMPANTEVVVLYEDRWMWDMTNYLFMLKIQFRDASNNVLIARGQSVRTSLVRKTVEEMVQETLVAVFSAKAEEV